MERRSKWQEWFQRWQVQRVEKHLGRDRESLGGNWDIGPWPNALREIVSQDSGSRESDSNSGGFSPWLWSFQQSPSLKCSHRRLLRRPSCARTRLLRRCPAEWYIQRNCTCLRLCFHHSMMLGQTGALLLRLQLVDWLLLYWLRAANWPWQRTSSRPRRKERLCWTKTTWRSRRSGCFERKKEWKNEWMNEWMNEWVNESNQPQPCQREIFKRAAQHPCWSRRPDCEPERLQGTMVAGELNVNCYAYSW